MVCKYIRFVLLAFAACYGCSSVFANEKNSNAKTEFKLINENPQPPSEAAIAEGKKLFLHNCASCHGRDGKGNTPMGKAIKTLPNFTDPSMNNVTDEQMFDTITNGHPPMPSFKRLSEEQRWDLIDYIRTFAQE